MSGIRWYGPSEEFAGEIAETADRSTPAWPRPPTPPRDAPNIVLVVLDDTGYGQLGCYGGLGGRIETPHIDGLAAAGLRYNNWHTTALCSPTRACLLTGRNHHSVGVGNIMEYATGYPGYNAQIPTSAAMLPAILRGHGYNTMAVGKWHLAPDEHISAAGPYDRWPLGQGFERFYGFLPGETDQWHPDLWYDNHRVDPPAGPEEGYHLSEDLVDRSIEFVNEQQAVAPEKPFFLYLAFAAHHSPHQAPRAYIDRYAGRFDAGWDTIREETLAEQIRLGVVPEGTVLPPRNPGVRPWAELSDLERRVLTRQMEAYAGFMTHTDDQVGRLVAFLRRIERLDDTLLIVCSDNGASGEGGPIGLSSEMSYFNMATETIEDLAGMLDDWGQPGTHPHYATGWAMAGNTPQRWYKQQVHEGGTRDPFVAHWPARLPDAGAVRTQFHHAVDVVPTVLDLLGVEPPAQVHGHEQRPIEGVSMAPSLMDGDAPRETRSQYFEIFGHRAVWRDGWKAVTFHWTKYLNDLYGRDGAAHDMDFDADDWELYHLDRDYSEAHDLAHDEPERLAAMIEAWWEEARRHQVLPLDDSNAARLQVDKPVVAEPRDRYVYRGPGQGGALGEPRRAAALAHPHRRRRGPRAGRRRGDRVQRLTRRRVHAVPARGPRGLPFQLPRARVLHRPPRPDPGTGPPPDAPGLHRHRRAVRARAAAYRRRRGRGGRGHAHQPGGLRRRGGTGGRVRRDGTRLTRLPVAGALHRHHPRGDRRDRR